MDTTIKTPRTGAVNPVNLLALAVNLEAVADRVGDDAQALPCLEAAEALRELADLPAPVAQQNEAPDAAERLCAAGQLLADVAQHIASARAMLRELADTDPVHGVADLLAVAGFLADFGAGLAGEAGHPGDAHDWLMKPTTRAAVAALGTKGHA